MSKDKINEVKSMFFLKEDVLKPQFSYPSSFESFVNDKADLSEPWDFFSSKDELDFSFKGLNDRYPERVLVPFARRTDNDDFACFDGSDFSGDPKVIIIHDWASPGWENHGEFDNFLEWLEFAKEQSEEWKSLGG